MKIHKKLKRTIVFLCSLLFCTLLSYSFIQPHIELALGANSCTLRGKTLTGTNGDDICNVPNGDSNLASYTILGLSGNDTLTGGGGRDNILGGLDNDNLYGGLGNDQIVADFGDDNLYGGAGNDNLLGDFGNDQLFGEDGNDKLLASVGDDNLFGGSGDDNLQGSLGQDNFDAGVGNDVLDGGADDDVLFGNDGDDTLTGDTGSDAVVGGNGKDSVTGFGNATGGTPEIDTLVGGGQVTFDDQGNASIDFSLDGVQDKLVLGNSNNAFYATAGDLDYAVIQGLEKGLDQIQLSPAVTHSFAIGSVFSSTDTLIFANLPTGSDLIAIVVGVDLTTN